MTMTIEGKAKAYDEVREKIALRFGSNVAEEIFSMFEETEGEKIRKALVRFHKSTIDIDGIKGADILAWLEKQGTPSKLSEEEQNSFAKGILSRCALSFINYLDAHSYEGKMSVSNGECEDIDYAFHNAMWDRLHRYYCKYIEKQGEQKPILDFKASNWYVSKVDGKIHDMTYNPTDRVEPKFKVKYAGSEYNVLEVKDIAGVTFYGIEDEPNHIDYVKAENCEIISGYATKENGSPYPTKSAVFSEQKPAAWSEEDENYLQSAENACEYQYGKNTSTILWLKSIKERITWKPSEEQIHAFEVVCEWYNNNFAPSDTLTSLYNDLKKL